MIDFHCHLDLYPDPHRIARECGARNMYVLSVTTTPSAWEGTAALADGASRIRTALGLHPQLAHERKAELPLFEKLLPRTRYVGEIGLDGGPELKPHWADQTFVFNHILKCCSAAGGRVLSIHSRRAASAVLDALGATPGAGVPILHWFSGTHRELARAIEMGCWFSIGPTMLGTEKGRALTSRAPRDRILTETDGPFASVEGRSALPWDVDYAVRHLSDLWRQPMVEVRQQLNSNLRNLIGSLPTMD
ncbi:Qat anti-phage system TatD family nuclease QatD [Microvirga guangxiensis]|uniref:TatD DNase family protein n=1 Tax=Microvirga guangxiensis TaxID=549386 RepID=A0A1G5KE50_9HYPH|nr:Qat anti-phage system TatD family nuclease QatD [Microvirga guangxiensis]SCY98872.1 TatD DNase family protein [Microvirga guangxiensis]